MNQIDLNNDHPDLDAIARNVNALKKTKAPNNNVKLNVLDKKQHRENGFFTAQGGYINYNESNNQSFETCSPSTCNEISNLVNDSIDDKYLISSSNSIETSNDVNSSYYMSPESIESIDSFNNNSKMLSHVNTCNNKNDKLLSKIKKPIWGLICDSIELKEFLIIIMMGMLIIIIIDIFMRQS